MTLGNPDYVPQQTRGTGLGNALRISKKVLWVDVTGRRVDTLCGEPGKAAPSPRKRIQPMTFTTVELDHRGSIDHRFL